MRISLRSKKFPTLAALSDDVVYLIKSELARLAERPGGGVVALTGASTAATAYRLLAKEDIDWRAAHLVQTDERVSGERSATSAAFVEDTLVRPAAVPEEHWHPIRAVPGDDLAARAGEYAGRLASLTGGAGIDVALLGMGTDGHVASLFADDAPVTSDEPVSVTKPYDGTVRLTLGVDVLAAARLRIVLAAGESKATAVARLVNGHVPPDDAATRILGGDGLLLVDEAAWAEVGR
ncbi:6-phosphogluconolactonase [Streptomyces sp. NPDC012623]|uniref:6-phosphogluconolactonase n=1 Tax=unclassified Streptomyces TaxID=2593676 RepID=UPI0036BC5AAF